MGGKLVPGARDAVGHKDLPPTHPEGGMMKVPVSVRVGPRAVPVLLHELVPVLTLYCALCWPLFGSVQSEVGAGPLREIP